MASYTNLSDLFTGIANSIRSKTGSTNKIIADDFPSEINNIVTVQEGTANATAAAGDIASGKTAYVNGKKVTGTGQMKKTAQLTFNHRYGQRQIYDGEHTYNNPSNSQSYTVNKGLVIVISNGGDYSNYKYSGCSVVEPVNLTTQLVLVTSDIGTITY